MTTPRQGDPTGLSDPRVDAAWRASSREEPPESLDAAILAAARREVGAKPQSTGAREALADRRRWWPFAAAATVAAIAVGVLQLTTSEQLGAPAPDKTVVTDMPAPAAAPAPDKATAPPRAEEAKPDASETGARAGNATPRADAPRRPAPAVTAPESTKQESAASNAAALPEPFPAAPPQRAAAAAAAPPPTGQVATSALAGQITAPAPSATAAAAAESVSARPAPLAKTAAGRAAESGAGETRAKDQAPLPVADWIALIRRLRDEGKPVGAAKELAAFRAAHLDHEKLLPPDLRDWRLPDR
jgi:hypothetical protein